MNEDERRAMILGGTSLHDVAQTYPAEAKEIARIVDLTEDSREEFLRLCQLLFDVGSVADAEFLLRRNAGYYEGEAFYHQLFGAEKQEELDAAIDAFKAQFGLDLTLIEEYEFLEFIFESDGGAPRSDVFQLLTHPCEVQIGYIHRDKIQADVVLLDHHQRDVLGDDAWLFMWFLNGVWELGELADE